MRKWEQRVSGATLAVAVGLLAFDQVEAAETVCYVLLGWIVRGFWELAPRIRRLQRKLADRKRDAA